MTTPQIDIVQSEGDLTIRPDTLNHPVIGVKWRADGSWRVTVNDDTNGDTRIMES